jgi:hypothetical protein
MHDVEVGKRSPGRPGDRASTPRASAQWFERLYYAPGPVTLTELPAFVERFPNGSPKTTPAHPPEASSATPPEASSMEPRDQDLEPSSCASGRPTSPSTNIEEEQPRVTRVDREVARIALAERMKRKHPTRPPPRWFDRADVEMVAMCAAAIDGDRDARLQALRDSIIGSFSAPKEGPPTLRFIWGAGALRRAFGARPTRGAGRRARRAPARARPPTREELAKTRAEFEELAASVAAPFRKHLESMAARYRELERKAE